jgi:hypothetical protein
MWEKYIVACTIKLLCQHLYGCNKETLEMLQDNWCPNQDLILTPPYYEYMSLLYAHWPCVN